MTELLRFIELLFGVPSLFVFCIGGLSGELTEVAKAYKAISQSPYWNELLSSFYLLLFLAHIDPSHWLNAAIMIPAYVGSCGFPMVTAFAPTPGAGTVHTWRPTIHVEVIDVRVE